MYFAHGLDRILDELKQRGLGDVIASAEIFNEVDGMSFVGGYGAAKKPVEELHRFRSLHEVSRRDSYDSGQCGQAQHVCRVATCKGERPDEG